MNHEHYEQTNTQESTKYLLSTHHLQYKYCTTFSDRRLRQVVEMHIRSMKKIMFQQKYLSWFRLQVKYATAAPGSDGLNNESLWPPSHGTGSWPSSLCQLWRHLSVGKVNSGSLKTSLLLLLFPLLWLKSPHQATTCKQAPSHWWNVGSELWGHRRF